MDGQLWREIAKRNLPRRSLIALVMATTQYAPHLFGDHETEVWLD
jgi:hypothetical protein